MDNKERGEYKMATQIAATPVLCGREAKRVMKEAKTMPSEKSKENAKNFMKHFNRFIVR